MNWPYALFVGGYVSFIGFSVVRDLRSDIYELHKRLVQLEVQSASKWDPKSASKWELS